MNPTTNASRTIAANVTAALREAGIAQRDAAAQTGIPIQTLSRRLTGKGKAFDVVELEMLANLVGCTVSDFIAPERVA